MKLKSLFVTGILLAATSLSACGGGGGGGDTPTTFTFTAEVQNANGDTITTIYTGTKAKAVVFPSIDPVDDKETREYTYTALNPSVASINSNGTISALKEGLASFYITEAKSSTDFTISNITVAVVKENADGGFNYASATGEAAVKERTKILGQLEKYAVDNHLTGISLFENGGLVKYRPEVEIPTAGKQYVNGYGFGILTDGDITEDLDAEQNTAWKRYYHSAESQDPNKINAWNATGSAVSDLNGYITSSYYGTKLNAAKDGYVWYPILAKEKVTINEVEVDQTYPIAVDAEGKTMSKKWRIYVKTGDIAYRTSPNSNKKVKYDNRAVAIEDYITPFKMLLTGSNAMIRGAEMAGDTSYGIKGAQAYYNSTKSTAATADAIDAAWQAANVGVKTGNDTVNGDYIEFELINPIDAFTARYVLSSNLYSPYPNEFFRDLDPEPDQSKKKYSTACKNYFGFFVDDDSILNHVLSLGAYYLDVWDSGVQTVFTRNDNWFEYTRDNRYKIPGVHIRVYDTSTDNQKIYKKFGEGLLHSTGIPKEKIETEDGKPYVYTTKGDSTFKLNVNSCTQEYWNTLFGPNGKIAKNQNWEVKPWMSNDSFLKGLYYSIDREQFAKARGVQPSTNYFSNAYVADGESGKPYNETDEHKEAVKEYQTKKIDEKTGKEVDAYGYDFDKAVGCFKTAVSQLERAGKLKAGMDVKIHIRWMYPTDKLEYGEDIASYFTKAFNHSSVSNGRYKLVVEQDAVTSWEDVYNVYMMKGCFDLAFGAISGNTLNPLNFLEVLKSDNSSGFTLNWGCDTSKTNSARQLVYDNKSWSFDALWAVADHGGVVENGEIAKNVKSCYIESATKPGSGEDTKGNYKNGVTFKIPVNFLKSSDTKVKFDMDAANGARVMLYVYGGIGREFNFVVDADNNVTFTVDAATASAINEEIRELYKLREEDGNKEWQRYLNVFTKDHYIDASVGNYWYIELTYNVTIGDLPTTQNYVDVEKDSESHYFEK